ncbi:MAG TPA: hypothetical protein VE031_13620 [Chthoniobacterales bacterium]|nr:hypothetical protein [Chthoniobacterales bacterium]
MSVPDNIREQLRCRLYELADEKNWMSLSVAEKSATYDAWTRDPAVGGVLSRFIRVSDVRLYLKDSLLKDYARQKQADDTLVNHVLGVSGAEVLRADIKPHGRVLADGRVFAWGRANAWKTILMATYERAHNEPGGKAFGVVLTNAFGQFHQPSVRTLIETAASKLGIERVVWLER